MSDLTDFLLARIQEDETAARRGLEPPMYGTGYTEPDSYTAAEEVIGMAYNEGVAEGGMKHFERWMPARVLAECEAKRHIVAESLDQNGGESRTEGLMWAVHALAAVYADHPDYRQEWAL